MSLYEKYRPQSLKDVAGNDDLKDDLKPFFSGKRLFPNAMLFSGPSGCGKTTLALIIAHKMGASEIDITVQDASDFRGIDSIRELRQNMWNAPLGGAARVWILDECFAAGTPVLTGNGQQPIETIKAGDPVYSAVGRDRVVRTFKNKVPLHRVCKITCQNFEFSLLSSVDHKFFTTRGWIEAHNLRGGDIIFRMKNDGRASEIQENLLHLWDHVLGETRPGEMLQEKMQADFGPTAQAVQKDLSPLRTGIYDGPEKTDTLFHILFKEMRGYGTSANGGSPREDIGETSRICTDRSGGVCAFTIQPKDENEQSIAQSCHCAKDTQDESQERYFERISGNARGQWKTDSAASAVAGQVENCSCGISDNFGAAQAGIPDLLQSGYSTISNETCGGNRRDSTPLDSTKEQGFEERSGIDLVRVDSVTVYEPRYFGQPGWGCIGDNEQAQGFVEFYDLELEKHHSYFVDGILVHNCHALTKQAMEALLKALESPPERVFFILCTTNPEQLLQTILTRCTQFTVEELTSRDMVAVLRRVCDGEGADVPDKTLQTIAKQANGSARAAISMLERVLGRDPEDYDKPIETFQEFEKKVTDLCKVLLKKADWKGVVKVLDGIKEEPETVRRQVLKYMSKVLRSGQDNVQAAVVIDCFKDSYFYSGEAGLVLSCYYSIQETE